MEKCQVGMYSDKVYGCTPDNIRFLKIRAGVAPPLKNKGIEMVVHEDFRKGGSWESFPYTRYFLVKNGIQIDGMDVETKKLRKLDITELLERNKLTSKKVSIYVK